MFTEEKRVESESSLIQPDESVEEYGLRRYMQDCMKEDLMDKDEEVRVFHSLEEARAEGNKKKQKELMDYIVCRNMRLVFSLAHKEFSNGFTYAMTMQDLLSEGSIGLMRAVEKYDVSRGFRFSTYATSWVMHALQNGVARYGTSSFSFQPHVFQEMKKVVAVYKNFQSQTSTLSFNSDADELFNMESTVLAQTAEACNISVVKVKEYLAAARISTSIDAEAVNDGLSGGNSQEKETMAAYMVADKSAEFEDDVLNKMEVQGVISLAQEILEPRSFDIFYSSCCKQPAESYEEIGKRYGLKKERVRQLDRRARTLLRFIKQNGSLPAPAAKVDEKTEENTENAAGDNNSDSNTRFPENAVVVSNDKQQPASASAF